MNIDILSIIQRTLSVMVGLPFAFQLWSFILCTGYKHAAVNINTTNREIFRSMKLRYTNSAKLNIPLADTDSFVSRYFYGKGGPFRFVTRIERAAGILICIALLSTTALYIRGLTDTSRMTAIIAATFCFCVFRIAISTSKQMELTISFTKDYLDNTLKHRVSPKPLRADRAALAHVSDTNSEEKIELKENDVSDLSDNAVYSPSNDSDIIEAVLQEFLA